MKNMILYKGARGVRGEKKWINLILVVTFSLHGGSAALNTSADWNPQ